MSQAPLTILRDPELTLSPLEKRTVAILGFGNQGRAHALNLADSGVSVLVGQRSQSRSRAEAEAAGLEVCSAAEAVTRADVVMVLAPDEAQAQLYEQYIRPKLRAGQSIAFGHGFAVHFGAIVPPDDVDVILVAPVGPGALLRSRFVEGGGIPVLTAVQQDATGEARAIALAYAKALGGGRAGVIETSFRDECETDLFGEQTVICGGVTSLILAGFETLVEAGYPEELAYFECAHQMKLLTDLIHDRGIAGMREAISNTAKYGDVTRGPRVVDSSVKARMKEALEEVRSGAFAREWMREVEAGRPKLDRLLEESQQHRIEAVGARLRNLGKGE